MPLHARFRASTSLLFLAALAFGVALAALGGGEAALAGTTGLLVPTGQGHYSAWSPNSGSNEVDAIDDGTCGTGDGMWITGSYGTPSSSFTLNLSSIPLDAPMQGIDVTICYSDSDGVTLPTVTPFIRVSNTDFLGTGIDPTDTAGTVSVTRHWDLYGAQAYDGLAIGVKHVGLIGQVKVWAMWAVVTWSPPPTPLPPPTASLSVTTIPGGPQPYAAGQIFDWQSEVVISPTSPDPIELVQTWDNALFGNAITASAYKVGGTDGPSCSAGTRLRCTFSDHSSGTFVMYVRLKVNSAEACVSTSSVVINRLAPGGSILLAQASPTVSLNGGCPTPTPTATASATSTPVPTATGTSPTSSATATGTSALATSTPTGTTGSNTSTTTPGSGTPTPTTTPTPTGTPSVPKPYHLRTMQLARDGTN